MYSRWDGNWDSWLCLDSGAPSGEQRDYFSSQWPLFLLYGFKSAPLFSSLSLLEEWVIRCNPDSNSGLWHTCFCQHNTNCRITSYRESLRLDFTAVFKFKGIWFSEFLFLTSHFDVIVSQSVLLSVDTFLSDCICSDFFKSPLLVFGLEDLYQAACYEDETDL